MPSRCPDSAMRALQPTPGIRRRQNQNTESSGALRLHESSCVRFSWLLASVFLLLTFAPREASPYSVLSHEAAIDEAWTSIRPLLARRFPHASPTDLNHARAFA